MSKIIAWLLATGYWLLVSSPALAQTKFSEEAGNFNPAKDFDTTTPNFLSELIGGNVKSPGLLVVALVFGGFTLLVMLILGGFQMLTNPTNPEAQEGGKKRITWAIAGFLLLFSSFWLIQIIGIIFNLDIV